MSIRIAVSGTEFDEPDGVDPLIATALSARIGSIEMWFPKNYVKDTVAGTNAKLRDAGLDVACISTPSTLYGPRRDKGRVLLSQALDLAEQNAAQRVNTYFGHADEVDDEAAIVAYAEAIAPIAAEAEARGMVIVLENEFDAFGWDPRGSDITRRPASLARLVARVDSSAFRLTFDAANFHCASVDAYADAYPLLGRHIGHVHVKDVRTIPQPQTTSTTGWLRYTDHGKTFDTTRLGAGEVSWRPLLANLVIDGYEGYLTLEPHCARERLDAEVRHAAEYLRTALEHE